MDWSEDSLDSYFTNVILSEKFLNGMDEDFDCAYALSLQEEEKALQKPEKSFNKIEEDLDHAIALSLQEEESKTTVSLPKSTPTPLSIVDKQWEVLDPTPDIHALFLQYNVQFFYGKLDGVEVKWSPRMTLCAGVCSYEGRGGLCSVRLSLPLLKLRPRRDLVETLLHEMIHAYLFVTANNKDHNAHGPEFLKHMNRINKETGTKISVYHSFHDEVDLYRKHIWRCNGPCQKKSPYYGYVKRAMNRAPGPKDVWWAQHKASCGGTYTKIQEPEGYKKTKTNQNENGKRKPLKDADNHQTNIKKFLKSPSSTAVSDNISAIAKAQSNKTLNTFHSNTVSSLPLSETNNVTAFTGSGFLLGSSSSAAPKNFLASIRREIASSSRAIPKSFLSNTNHKASSSAKSNTYDKVHNKPSSVFKNSTLTFNSNKATPKESCVLGVVQNSLKNNIGNMVAKDTVRNEAKKINNQSSSKSIPGFSQKSSYVQSSMEKFVSSPSRSIMVNSTKVTDRNSNTPPKVNCPVCLKLFLSSEINSHLDSCLMT